jgi:2-polyprenyl-3-methyl-5-hydroxy-6-metoxy-1,4-benzoquinol methylase
VTVINNVSTADNSDLHSKLNEFLNSIPIERISGEIATQSDLEAAEILEMLNTFAEESRVSLNLIKPRLHQGQSILEVGAGLCLLSLFLKQQGHIVTALEPALGGFGVFEQAKNAIIAHFSDTQLRVLTEPAQQLNPDEHGKFDLIFSNNVMEHIPDWRSAMRAMVSVLREDGKMVHSCPNYTVPYEPHYGIPVFRHFHELSARLFLPGDADREVWDSLNFITCGQVKHFCKTLALYVEFEKGLLYKAFLRVHKDFVFQQRHKGLVSFVASLAVKTPFKQLVRNIPYCLSTPMIFEIRH